ncbi:MAG: SMC-Scp complex subunit ScpB [Planctomycetota bacterium]|nr:SMC-Scp complex subunit ScpB [Planctomycetota bacterium]
MARRSKAEKSTTTASELAVEFAPTETQAAESVDTDGVLLDAPSAIAVADESGPNVDSEFVSTPDSGPGDQLSDDELLSALTALVFASPEPITMRRLLEILENPARTRLAVALDRLREGLAASHLPLELREIAGGFQILTKPEMGEIVQRLFKARRAERISSAALETLAVIAYRQPVSKAEIEAIRGVQAGPILRTLIERGLVRVTGRADVPGHPLQYGTTREFLDRFGLGTLEDLPRDAELTKD